MMIMVISICINISIIITNNKLKSVLKEKIKIKPNK